MTDLSILKDPAIVEKFSMLPRSQQVAYMWRMK